MKPKQIDMKKRPRDISVANLPEDLTIKDPKEFIHLMRSNLLSQIRVLRGFALEDVAKRCDTTVEEVKRIESGKVTETDMMLLGELAELYEIDYSQLLYMFKLAQLPSIEKTWKMAAYHDQKADEETLKRLMDFIESIKDSIK